MHDYEQNAASLKSQPEIVRGLTLLMDEMSSLYNLANDVDSAFSRVLRPIVPTPTVPANPVPLSVQTELGIQIDQILSVVRNTKETLMSVIGRKEI